MSESRNSALELLRATLTPGQMDALRLVIESFQPLGALSGENGLTWQDNAEWTLKALAEEICAPVE